MASDQGNSLSATVVLKEAVAVVERLHAALAADGSVVSDAESCARMRALFGLRRQVDGVVGMELERFRARDAGVHDGAASTQAWLRHRADMSEGESNRQVRIARATTSLPAAGAAFGSGALSAEKLMVLTRTAEQVGAEVFAPAEENLVAEAQRVSLAELRRSCEEFRRAVDRGAPDREHAERHRRREVYLAPTSEGLWSLRGTLTPECGAALSTVLSGITPRPTSEDERTGPQRRHDAVHDLARAILDEGGLAAVGGERPHIGVVTHLSDVSRVRAGAPVTRRSGAEAEVPPAPGGGVIGADDAVPGGPGFVRPGWPVRLPVPEPGGGVLEGGGVLPSAALQRYLCDSQVYRIVFGPDGHPTEVGRKHRTVPAWLRRALVARDGGCRFPGCDRPPQFTEAHHVVPWSEGGATGVDNCLLTCRRHHHLIHDAGWTLTFNGNVVAVRRPDGTPVEPP